MLPFWQLSRAGLGIVALPSLEAESETDVEARCREWLDAHCFQVRETDGEYQIYRMTDDFWNPVKAKPPRYVIWLVRQEAQEIAQLPYPESTTPEGARASLRAFLAAHAFECIGGPWDGRRLADKGPSFQPEQVVSDTVDDGAVIRKAPIAGLYVRDAARYHWTRGD
jgi:hypothetical protein